MPKPRPALFKWRHFEPEITVVALYGPGEFRFAQHAGIGAGEGLALLLENERGGAGPASSTTAANQVPVRSAARKVR
jgi:hypothetical protein